MNGLPELGFLSSGSLPTLTVLEQAQWIEGAAGVAVENWIE